MYLSALLGASSANVSSVTLGAGVVPGGRGVGVIDVEAEKRRGTNSETNPEASKIQLEGLHPSGLISSRNSGESGTPNRSAEKERGRKLEKSRQTPLKSISRSRSRITRPLRRSLSGMEQVTQDVYVDKVIEIPGDETEDSWSMTGKLQATSPKNPSVVKSKSSSSTAKQPPSRTPVRTATGIRKVKAAVGYSGDEPGLTGGVDEDNVDNSEMDIVEELPMKPKSQHLGSGTEPKASSKAKGKAISQQSTGEKAEGSQQSKGRSTAKPNSFAPSTNSRPQTPNLFSEPEGHRPKLVRRYSVTSRARSAHSEVDGQPTKKDKRPLSRSRGNALGLEGESIHLHASSDSDSEPAHPSRRGGAPTVTPIKSGMKPKPRVTPKPEVVEDDENSDPELYTRPDKGKKVDKDPTARTKLTTSQSKARRSTSKSATKLRERQSSTRSPSPSPTKAINTPKRTMSVLMPSLSKEYFTPRGSTKIPASEDQGTDAEELRPSQLSKKRAEVLLISKPSMQAIAAEASTSATKRGRPSRVDKSTRPTIKNASHSKTRRSEGSIFDAGNDTSMVVDLPVDPVRSGPRRSAANKATMKLREEVMPDLISYEKERKNEKRRRTTGDESTLSLREVEDEEDGLRKKRRKVDEEGTTSKSRKTKQREDEEAEVERAVTVPKEKRKATKVVHLHDDDDGDGRRGEGNSRSQESKAGSQSMDNP